MAYNDETNNLRADLLDATSRWTPQLPGKIIRKVQTTWGGELCERRLWRLLAWLLERRYVCRILDEDTGQLQGYVRLGTRQLEISERTRHASAYREAA